MLFRSRCLGRIAFQDSAAVTQKGGTSIDIFRNAGLFEITQQLEPSKFYQPGRLIFVPAISEISQIGNAGRWGVNMLVRVGTRRERLWPESPDFADEPDFWHPERAF